jgi:two-component system torCAD operon response regulator TorR
MLKQLGGFATPVGEAPLPETDAHILVVEDDPVTRANLVGYFESEGYRVSEAEDGQSMWPLLSGQPVDLVLLDVNLPGEDGLYLTRQLRAQFNFGIILVTGRTDDVDRIVGLEIGADDYVTKPFNQRELLARVKNILRRIPAARGADAGLKHFAAWVFDPQRRKLTGPDDRSVGLTRAEYELLSALVSHPGEVMSRERLLSQVTHRNWDPNDRTIDVLVRRLRKKVENDPKAPEIILTAHGEGYLFAADVS